MTVTEQEEVEEVEEVVEQEVADETTEEPSEAETALVSLEAFLATQTPAVRKLFEKEVDGLKSALKKERKDAGKGRTALAKLKTLETEAAAAAETVRQANLTEVQRANEERDRAIAETASLKTKMENDNRDVAIKAAASLANFADPSEVLLVIDPTKIVLKGDKYVGIAEEIARIAALKPHWIKDAKRTILGTPITTKAILGGDPEPVAKPLAPLVSL